MSLPVTTRLAGPYSCNGSLVAFDFVFKVFTESDLRVVLTDSAAAETDLVITTNYTVSLNADQENDPGGTITTVSTYATGYKITIVGDLAYGQPTVLTNLGGFFPKTIEYAMDRLGILIQQLKESVGRAVRVPVSSGASGDLPAPSAGLAIGWNATEDGFVNLASPGSLAVTPFAETVLDDTTAAAMRATLGVPATASVLALAGDTMTGDIIMSGASIIETEGAAVASASTCNIWATDGNTVHITGTTTITSFGTAPQAGAWMKVIFDGALTLTHGANLNLPGSASITTAANDWAFVYADATTLFRVVYFKADGTAVVSSSTQTSEPYIYIRDEKANTTDAGTSTGAAWNTRVLNTKVSDVSGLASIAANQITLAAGTYRVFATAPSYAADRNKLRLRNITDTTTTIIGVSNYATGGQSTLSGRFTIAGSKTFELQHFFEIGTATIGLGPATSSGETEIYASIEFWKEF